jgi:O-antigen biosynthesis protein WbqP
LIRLIDIVLSAIGILVLWPLLLVLYAAGYMDTGAPLFRQVRVGRDRKPFTLIKFRTMRPDTLSVATHLADISAVTPLGSFLRRTKLDELPQLWNVLKGEMSLVGPRPCLVTQEELIAERVKRAVFDTLPGITGLAQVRGIDMSTPCLLAETDAQMLASMSITVYFKFILATVTGSGRGDRIGHGEE